MKKSVGILISMMLMFSLASCGSNIDNRSNSVANNKTEKTVSENKSELIEETLESEETTEPLVDQAAEEQDDDARLELASHIEDISQYNIIILGYPNWWGDMPQALYTFLEEYDLSGKTIVPFVTHGGRV